MTGPVDDAVGFAGAVGSVLDVVTGALAGALFRMTGGLARRGWRTAGTLAATGNFVTSIEGLVGAGAARETFPIVMKSGGGSGARCAAVTAGAPSARGSTEAGALERLRVRNTERQAAAKTVAPRPSQKARC